MSERENELFEEWWKNEGQYNRAGGGDYEKTFAYYAWMAVVNRQGYKLVPVEPNKDTLLLMCDEAADCTDINEMHRAYKAMIGAVE